MTSIQNPVKSLANIPLLDLTEGAVRSPHLLDLHKLLSGIFPLFSFSRNLHGEFLYVHSDVQGILGYSPEHFLENWRDIWVDGNDLRRFSTLVPKVDPGAGGYNYCLEVITRQEGKIWLEVHEQGCYDKKGQLTHYDGVALDMTARKTEERKLLIREKRYREISQSSPVGIFHADPDDKLIYINPGFQKITGRTLSDTLGKPWWEFIHPEDQKEVFQHWANAETKGEETFIKCRVISTDGQVLWVQLRSKFINDGSSKITFGTLENINDLKLAQDRQEEIIQELLELKQKLENSARTDMLTGLPNRRAWNEFIHHELNRFERTRKPFSILLTDIDNFKKINDTYGHEAGDAVLRYIAKILKLTIRKQDLVCRWGGEEFIFLLPETPLGGAKTVAEKIRQRVEAKPVKYMDHIIPVTTSIGVSCFTEARQKINVTIKTADDCLYKAKKSGRNRVISPEEL